MPSDLPTASTNEDLAARVKELEGHLAEAHRREDATAEVLRVISRSTFDLQTVLDTLVETAVLLCEARRGIIFRREGESYHGAAFYNVSPELIDFIGRHPITPGRDTIAARVALERQTVHVPDLQADTEYKYALRDVDPIRTDLGVPMFRGDEVVGIFVLYKLEVQPFTDKQIELVATFADQAVIAIENTRLFEEVQARTRELTGALSHQTATSDVLDAISRSPTNVQPVFDMIAESAARLCKAKFCHVFRFDGSLIHFAASYGLTSEGIEAIRGGYPMVPGQASISGRTILNGSVQEIPDIERDPEYHRAHSAQTIGYRSILSVPILNMGRPVGAIVVGRSEPGSLREGAS